MSLANYDIAKLLGKGSFGEVFLAQSKKNPGKLYAVKKIRDMAEDGYFDVVGIKETEFYNVVQRYKIPGVVHMEESLIHPDEYNTYVVMDAYLGGSLETLITDDRYMENTIENRLRLWGQYVGTIRDMHSVGMYHLDIKTENFLCKESGTLLDSVICDGSNVIFNIANQPMNLPHIPFISPVYRPPEFTTYTDMSHPDKADVWSLGILFVEMFGGAEFIESLNKECDEFASKVQPELRKYKNLYNNKNKMVSVMHIAKDLNKDKSELNDRVFMIHYVATMLDKLKKVNLWDEYLSKDEIYRGANPKTIKLVKNLTNFVQKYILTGSSSSRISSQQICDVLEKNIPGVVSNDNIPKPEFIHISRNENNDTVWKGIFDEFLSMGKDIKVYRGGVKQEMSEEFIYYAKALCDYYISSITSDTETNIKLTFGACLILAGELTCCDIRRKELMSLGILPEEHYEDYEHVLKARIKKVYSVLCGKMAYVVSSI